jgi:hypothetical protein
MVNIGAVFDEEALLFHNAATKPVSSAFRVLRGESS